MKRIGLWRGDGVRNKNFQDERFPGYMTVKELARLLGGNQEQAVSWMPRDKKTSYMMHP